MLHRSKHESWRKSCIYILGDGWDSFGTKEPSGNVLSLAGNVMPFICNLRLLLNSVKFNIGCNSFHSNLLKIAEYRQGEQHVWVFFEPFCNTYYNIQL